MVTILIAQQIAECPRKQEENVQLQGAWVFHSGLQWGLEVECLRRLGILTPFVAVLDVYELHSMLGGHPWHSGIVWELNKLLFASGALDYETGKDLPSSQRQIQTLCEASGMAWLCLCRGSEGMHLSYRLLSSIAQFSLPLPPLQ